MDYKKLACDMVKGCSDQVSHLDNKGYVYCSKHSLVRKQSHRCRKLKPAELRRLEQGQSLERY